MLVHFRKTSTRRYAVVVERERAPKVIANAPGYDDYLPHDLLHFVAEAEWGLDGAVFGQLAAGGDPGLFLPVEPELVGRWLRRRKLRPKAHPKGRRSELLALALECAWYARRRRRPLPDGWDDLVAKARIDPERLSRVVASLDELAERWHDLRIGEELTLEWPRPERRRRRATRPHREKRGRLPRRHQIRDGRANGFAADTPRP
jgi:hypothetical protein